METVEHSEPARVENPREPVEIERGEASRINGLPVRRPSVCSTT